MRLNETKQKKRARKLAFLAELLDECIIAFVTYNDCVRIEMLNTGSKTPQQLIDFCVDHAASIHALYEDVSTVTYLLTPNNEKGGFRV